MHVIHRIVRSAVLALGVAALLAPAARAHVGSGLAVDKNGQVYFLDTGSGLWRIDRAGKLTKLDEQRFHWLALDGSARADGQIPSSEGSTTGGGWVISRIGADPRAIVASDWPIAVDDQGNLYYPAGSPGSLQLVRTLASGATSVFATLPARVTDGPLPHVNGLAAGPAGSIYYTEDTAIRRITAKGEISIAATIPRVADAPAIPGIGADSGPLLRGLQVDAEGVMYVAAEGDGRVLRVTPEGAVATLLRSRSPWSPTAVAVFDGDVYVLEFLHTARDVRADWFPRVSRIAADGKQTILATVDRMPGARDTLPPAPMAVEDLQASVLASGDCRLDWKAPALGSGVEASLGAVSHYRIEYRPRPAEGSTGTWDASLTSTETSFTIQGLGRGAEHQVRVIAINAGGESVPSRVMTVTVPM